MSNGITVINIREYLSSDAYSKLGEVELSKLLSEYSCIKNPDVENFLKNNSIEFTNEKKLPVRNVRPSNLALHTGSFQFPGNSASPVSPVLLSFISHLLRPLHPHLFLCRRYEAYCRLNRRPLLWHG